VARGPARHHGRNTKKVPAETGAICSAQIVVPSQIARVPSGFDAWFARAVCRDVEQRFQTAGELWDALREVLESPHEWVGADTPASALGGDEDTQRIEAFPSSARDRRHEARIPSSIPAAIDGQRDLRNTALVYNASRSGALLTTQRPWRPEQLLELNLHLDSPTDGALVSAQVVRVSPRDDPFWIFDIAVRFVEPLSEELLARIQARAESARQL
jgi:hypothetical protein